MTKETKNWILLILLACVWGSSFILMKRGMFTSDHQAIFNDGQVGALRMFIAGLVLLPFAVNALKRIQTFKEFICLAIVGFCGNFFPAFLFTYAETGISSGFAGMLNSFTPIFTMIIGFIVFKNKLTLIQFIGLIIGSIGIILLVQNASVDSAVSQLKGDWRHITAIVLATLCYAISLNTIKFTLQKFQPIEITSLAFGIVFIPSIIAGIKTHTITTALSNQFAMEGLIYITLLSVFGTAIAVILFNKLISNSSTLFSSSVTYFIPMVAVLIGMTVGEKITFGQIGAMFVILFGVFIANYWLNIKAKLFPKN